MGIVLLKDLVKSYGQHIAVNNLNLKVNEGEIYGILGPNGAGKSTTINMLTGLLTPSSGEVHIFEKKLTKNSRNIKSNIGIVPQDIAIYEDLTAIENVMFFGSLYNLKGQNLKENAKRALEFVGLSERAREKPSNFSGGMKRRLNIACAIVHNPKLIIMDEPTVGIDPQSRNHILDSIKKLRDMGSTIIYTSHYMEEIQHICTNIVIIDHGKLIVEGKIEDILTKYSSDNVITIQFMSSISKEDVEAIEDFTGVRKVIIKDKMIIVENNKNVNNLDKIILHLTNNNLSIVNIERKHNDLEAIFLTLTGKSLRD